MELDVERGTKEDCILSIRLYLHCSASHILHRNLVSGWCLLDCYCRLAFRTVDHFREQKNIKNLPTTRSEEHRLNSSHLVISYAVFCLKKKNIQIITRLA